MKEYKMKIYKIPYTFATTDEGDGLYIKEGEKYRKLINEKEFTLRECREERLKIRRRAIEILSQL